MVAWTVAGARTPSQATQYASAGCICSGLRTHEHCGADSASGAGADWRRHAVAQVLRVSAVSD